MRLFDRRGDRVPAPVLQGAALTGSERVMAAAQAAGAWVLATTFRLVEVGPDGTPVLDRSWHEVDTGRWDDTSRTLHVTFVGGGPPCSWTFGGPGDEQRLPEALRERVEASVLVSEPLGLAGPRRAGRVVLRKDLRTQEVFVQPVLGRATSPDDPQVQAAVAWVGAVLAEQAGLDRPHPAPGFDSPGTGRFAKVSSARRSAGADPL